MLTLRLIHAGVTNSSVYISDVHDGKDQNGRVMNRKPLNMSLWGVCRYALYGAGSVLLSERGD